MLCAVHARGGDTSGGIGGRVLPVDRLAAEVQPPPVPFPTARLGIHGLRMPDECATATSFEYDEYTIVG
jgi:hypothetical protein